MRFKQMNAALMKQSNWKQKGEKGKREQRYE